MEFRDKVTGHIVSSDNPFVIEQCYKHSDRYEAIKPKVTEPEKKKTNK